MSTPLDPAPIVALGASAGGVKALSEFFASVPEHTGAAFVVVLHMDPSAESHLSEILSKSVAMPVAPVNGPTAIEPDHVYVLQPDQTLTVENGMLVTRKRTKPAGQHHPVDELFRSIAAEREEGAIAVVLSGTGLNGSRAISMLHERGGLVIVQDPDTADFRQMPENAIATGMVDRVLPPSAMPGAIGRYLDHLGKAPRTASPEDIDQQAGLLGGIVGLLHARKRIDFKNYKKSTLLRRIHRRVGLSGAPDVTEYARLLKERPQELDALLDDLLIGVTRFRRDPKAWDELEKMVLAPLVAAHAADRPIRVWLPGCATGEEAYTLAMLLVEEARRQGKPLHYDIFATDVSQTSLAVARRGIYSLSSLEELTATQKREFFKAESDNEWAVQGLRDMIVFAEQNLVDDPPFSQLDLVICRNLFIYLLPEVQERIVKLFHFALREGGALFLGSAESLSGPEDLFRTVSREWRIFERIGPTRHDMIEFPTGRAHNRVPRGAPDIATGRPRQARFAEAALQALADRHAPASVVIDRKMEVLYFHGDLTGLLVRPSGEATQDLVKLVHKDLRAPLRRAVRDLQATGAAVAMHCRLISDGASESVEIEASPVENGRDRQLILVSFRREAIAQGTAAAAEESTQPDSGLEEEVNLLRDELRSAHEYHRQAQEDLNASNEEVTSMNEELRSANEELESSKEELQAVNEELTTVNVQLRHRIDELQQSTSDFRNLLSASELAMLFLDREQRIREFSPAAAPLFNLIPGDIGRPIADLASRLSDKSFDIDCRTVLRTLAPIERNVHVDRGRRFLRRILAYRTLDDRIDGLVVTFVDVTEIQRQREFAERIVETVPMPLAVLDRGLKVVSANPKFYSTFKVAPKVTERQMIYEIGNGQWNIPELRRLLEHVLSQDEVFEGHLVVHEFETIGKRAMLLSGRRLDHVQLILLAIEDVTERVAAQTRQDVLVSELNHRVKNALAVVQALATQTAAHSNSFDEFRPVFEGRLHSFAQAHARLMERAWEGGELQEIVRDALSSRIADPDRIEIKNGERVSVTPKAALALNLVLHELATNALKYGALAAEGGRIDLSWTLESGAEGREVHLRWHEVGGPKVEPPTKKGFGTRLVEQAMSYEGGAAHLEFVPTGLRCELVFPIS